MRKTAKVSLVAGAAALVMGFAVHGAGAEAGIEARSPTFRIAWRPVSITSGASTTRCNLTLEGYVHSNTMAKTAGALIGYLVEVSVRECTGGSATVLTSTLPWHVRYEGFTGRLPTIEGVKLTFIELSLSVQPTGSLNCLVRTSSTSPLKAIFNVEASSAVTGVALEPGSTIPETGEALCAFASASFEGTGRLTTTATGSSVSITLI